MYIDTKKCALILYSNPPTKGAYMGIFASGPLYFLYHNISIFRAHCVDLDDSPTYFEASKHRKIISSCHCVSVEFPE